MIAKARIGMHHEFLSDEELRTAHLFLVEDIAAAVDEELRSVGTEARVKCSYRRAADHFRTCRRVQS